MQSVVYRVLILIVYCRQLCADVALIDLRRSTAVGAASFWNYNSSWSFDGLTDRYLGFAAVLEARGLFTCPANCTLVKTAESNVGCDYNYACGKRYS